jgi:hypothetical protein
MSLAEAISSILDPLIDGWCGRRAIKPLRNLLPSFPRAQWLTDDCHDLINALKDTRACGEQVTTEERGALTKAIILLQDALENRS